MLNLLLVLATVAGFDIGGRVGIAFPTGGINRTVRSSTIIGTQAGYSWLRHRLALVYSFFSFPGKQISGYQINIHELALVYNYELLHHPGWGIALSAGPGLGLISRSSGSARETGKSPDCHLELIFSQREGRSRVAAGLDNILFIEPRTVTYFPGLYAEVAYAF